MKVDIDKALNPLAGGAWRGGANIVPGRRNAQDVTPAGVAFVMMGEGQTVRVLFSTEEARAIGEMLLVCGAVAEGGMPPVAEPPPPASPLIINGGRA